jgi:hypothetical protein
LTLEGIFVSLNQITKRQKRFGQKWVLLTEEGELYGKRGASYRKGSKIRD